MIHTLNPQNENNSQLQKPALNATLQVAWPRFRILMRDLKLPRWRSLQHHNVKTKFPENESVRVCN